MMGPALPPLPKPTDDQHRCHVVLALASPTGLEAGEVYELAQVFEPVIAPRAVRQALEDLQAQGYAEHDRAEGRWYITAAGHQAAARAGLQVGAP
jgi:DNA-binding IclR family transcriptional regulator